MAERQEAVRRTNSKMPLQKVYVGPIRSMAATKRHSMRRFVLISVICWLAATFLLVLQFQNIYDTSEYNLLQLSGREADRVKEIAQQGAKTYSPEETNLRRDLLLLEVSLTSDDTFTGVMNNKIVMDVLRKYTGLLSDPDESLNDVKLQTRVNSLRAKLRLLLQHFAAELNVDVPDLPAFLMLVETINRKPVHHQRDHLKREMVDAVEESDTNGQEVVAMKPPLLVSPQQDGGEEGQGQGHIPEAVIAEAREDTRLQQLSADLDLPRAVYDRMPANSPGEMGTGYPVDVNALSPEDKRLYDEGQKAHGFSQFSSDHISLHRSLKDLRPSGCPTEFRREDLPMTSIIMCFYNEAWSVLLRSVHSILDRSPDHLLKEIILVDDFSTMDHLKQPLEQYFSNFRKVRVVRAKKREGLIRARLLGVAVSTAPVLTFLDSHIECAPGWLEPQLARIADNPSTVVAPVIDMISADDFTYTSASPNLKGGFDLRSLTFQWKTIPQRELDMRKTDTEPIRSPTISGGLFSIDKEYFRHIGSYDEGMDIWGVENLELSFRVWMCGGALEILPCARVGHVFRKDTPYSWGRSFFDIIRKNTVRMAEVWLDEYKQFYYERMGYSLGDYGDVTARQELRRQLKCETFDWYLKNVFPDINMPPKTLFLGEIQWQTRLQTVCLEWDWRAAGGASVGISRCHGERGYQLWQLTEAGEAKVGDSCLSYQSDTRRLVIRVCDQRKRAEWQWVKLQSGQLQHLATGQCLERGGWSEDPVLVSACSDSDSQLWLWTPLKLA